MDLRTLRESLGKTQGEVARIAEMTQPQLSRVERRRDHLLSTVRRYAAALGGEVQVIVRVDGRQVILRDI
ncbi:MAG TPA: helix-turn-helix transcriptional regulator [Polyangia bacterium]|nr:helix-turn-helix transcriptional regulator [Polyangia bacterium]